MLQHRSTHTDCGILDYQVFMLLDLNAVMSIIANVPAAIASTVKHHNQLNAISHILAEQIVACRAVRRLTQYTSQGPEMFRCVFRSHFSQYTLYYCVSPVQAQG